jgi:hypothetical protein
MTQPFSHPASQFSLGPANAKSTRNFCKSSLVVVILDVREDKHGGGAFMHLYLRDVYLNIGMKQSSVKGVNVSFVKLFAVLSIGNVALAFQTLPSLRPGDVVFAIGVDDDLVGVRPSTGEKFHYFGLPPDTATGLAFGPTGRLFISYRHAFIGEIEWDQSAIAVDPTTGHVFVGYRAYYGTNLNHYGPGLAEFDGVRVVRDISFPSEIRGISLRAGILAVAAGGQVYLGTTGGTGFTVLQDIGLEPVSCLDIDEFGNIFVGTPLGVTKLVRRPSGVFSPETFILGGPIILLALNDDGTLFTVSGDRLNPPLSFWNSDGSLKGTVNGIEQVEAFHQFAPSAMAVYAPLRQSNVDTIPPTTSATTSSGPNGNGWFNTNVTVNLTSADNFGGSGVKQIQFALGGAQNTGFQAVVGNTAAVTISAEGTTVLTYFATDNAGNQETAKTLTVRIDKTPPVISGMPGGGCTLWPPNGKLVRIVTVAANDATSRLMPGSFSVIGSSNEPSDPKNPDVVILPNGAGGYTVQLRADRLETGNGRVYTLMATAGDYAGNTNTVAANCLVPHDQGSGGPN